MGSSGRMTSARRRKLMDQLGATDIVRVADLAQSFQVSEITVRRDLDELAEQGLIERVHGGARLIAHRPADAAEGTDAGQVGKKRLIAAAAARLVRPGDTVLLSGGTTTLAVFREISRMDVRIITNNATVLGEMTDDTAATLFVLGGEYNRDTRALNGDLTNLTLNEIYGTICFLGTNAMSQHTGLTSSIYAAASINRLMATQCKGNVVVVADSSKIGKTSHFVSLPLSQVRVLVTDDDADQGELAAYRNSGIETVVCRPGQD
ncbi:DeoR/GlpR family DNA-binding transcription regulator [Telmatospirillum sp.]|uniref:DeoR/GlpR family DNA-binding transcription regulator n=1 Tax=Telmatospirillum sp. TaxID=2079197 RepID=UPI002843C6E2|nr:DeoR/GlpR family DNA-binding transcription regulator [Telmatospirillum sp.]MDR3440029.1 DeoR/GlpR family DNA-binding transcription regulator [Telmatospirillum sp.]